MDRVTAKKKMYAIKNELRRLKWTQFRLDIMQMGIGINSDILYTVCRIGGSEKEWLPRAIKNLIIEKVKEGKMTRNVAKVIGCLQTAVVKFWAKY